MYSRVLSMLRGSGRMIRRAATTTGSLPLSKSLLRTLLKRVSVSRRKVASFLAGTRNQSSHLTEFCRKGSLCFRSTAVSWSGNPAFSIKEIPRDSCSSTRLGTHRYSGDDSQSGRGTQANTYSDRTRSQGASSDTGEGSLERRLNRSRMLALAGIAAIFCRCRHDPAAANPAKPLLTLRWTFPAHRLRDSFPERLVVSEEVDVFVRRRLVENVRGIAADRCGHDGLLAPMLRDWSAWMRPCIKPPPRRQPGRGAGNGRGSGHSGNGRPRRHEIGASKEQRLMKDSS